MKYTQEYLKMKSAIVFPSAVQNTFLEVERVLEQLFQLTRSKVFPRFYGKPRTIEIDEKDDGTTAITYHYRFDGSWTDTKVTIQTVFEYGYYWNIQGLTIEWLVDWKTSTKAKIELTKGDLDSLMGYPRAVNTPEKIANRIIEAARQARAS